MNQTPSKPIRVLLVDDDEEIRIALAKVLEREGYSVTGQPDGLSAVHCLAQAETPFDLVITDAVMPGIGGLELLQLLKADPTDVPVIMITAFGDCCDYSKARGKGAFAYLCKPLEIDVLLETMERALTLHAIKRPACATTSGRPDPVASIAGETVGAGTDRP